MTGKGSSAPISGGSGLSYEAAVSLQEDLRARLTDAPPASPVRLVAGADVAFVDRKTAVAGILCFTWPDLHVVDVAVAHEEVTFPYVPGLLSFREVPVISRAFSRLSVRPDVIFCDGQGFAHPRRLGLACHLGIELDVATIGCAKSRLVGTAGEPDSTRASRSPLTDGSEVIGCVLRTRDNVKPLYISRGHRMDLETAVSMVLEAGRGYRLPEPTRRADRLVAKAKKAAHQGR